MILQALRVRVPKTKIINAPTFPHARSDLCPSIPSGSNREEKWQMMMLTTQADASSTFMPIDYSVGEASISINTACKDHTAWCQQKFMLQICHVGFAT